jgi:hypothetical protein
VQAIPAGVALVVQIGDRQEMFRCGAKTPGGVLGSSIAMSLLKPTA